MGQMEEKHSMEEKHFMEEEQSCGKGAFHEGKDFRGRKESHERKVYQRYFSGDSRQSDSARGGAA